MGRGLNLHPFVLGKVPCVLSKAKAEIQKRDLEDYVVRGRRTRGRREYERKCVIDCNLSEG